ncbi:MAG: hypothetical protein AABZ06_14600 [Bdellovibrionota bacterium]
MENDGPRGNSVNDMDGTYNNWHLRNETQTSKVGVREAGSTECAVPEQDAEARSSEAPARTIWQRP